jgi:ParB family chromosome partitioning protein
MKLDFIALDKLSVSKANMRDGKKPPVLIDILPSIRARGILVPVLVRPNGSPDHYEIVAGRRRYHAALAVAAETGEAEPMPCAILTDTDDAGALEASLIENIARHDPHEVIQWATFTNLVKGGRTVAEIEATFGLPEVQIKRILALGHLLPRIRDLYRAEAIDRFTVRQLTLASKSQQKAWIALHDDPDTYCPTGHQLKTWLFGGAAVSTANALFDLITYPGQLPTCSARKAILPMPISSGPHSIRRLPNARRPISTPDGPTSSRCRRVSISTAGTMR